MKTTRNTGRISALAALAALAIVVAFAPPARAQEDSSAQTADATLANANNPLANMVAFNIQNYYYAALYGTDETANTAWLRYAQPFGKWLMRASLPIQTVPAGAGLAIDPEDDDAFVRAIVEFVTDDARRHHMIAAAAARDVGAEWNAARRALTDIWKGLP